MVIKCERTLLSIAHALVVALLLYLLSEEFGELKVTIKHKLIVILVQRRYKVRLGHILKKKLFSRMQLYK